MEGSQASSNADYAVSQFKDLNTLLFEQGRNIYFRITYFILIFLYKNAVFSICQFLNSSTNLWSCQTLFDSWYVLLYNSLFMIAPLLAASLFDVGAIYLPVKKPKGVHSERPLSVERSIESQRSSKGSLYYDPAAYRDSQANLNFNITRISALLMMGACHAIIIYFGTCYACRFFQISHPSTLWTFSVLVYCEIFFVVSGVIVSQITRWTWIFIIALIINTAALFLFLIISQYIPAVLTSGLIQVTLGSLSFWVSLILIVSACLIPLFAAVKFSEILQTENTQVSKKKKNPLQNLTSM